MHLTREGKDRDRLKAGAGVVLFHALLGYLFVTGLGVEILRGVSGDLKVFTVPEAVPPLPLPSEVRKDAPQGAAAPPSLKAKAAPVVAPPPKIRLDVPPPVTAATEPTPAEGSEQSAGSADVDGPGTGAGGQGAGTGSGGHGSGIGGGAAVPARRLSGFLSGEQDYPPAARRAGIQGSVVVRFTVEPDGRVSGCRVMRSTAGPELEEVTCRLIERRFRYEPARDAFGHPVSDTVSRTFDWLLPGRR